MTIGVPCAGIDAGLDACGQFACQTGEIVVIVTFTPRESSMHRFVFFTGFFYFWLSSPKAVE